MAPEHSLLGLYEMRRIAIVTNVIPNYRRAFYGALFASDTVNITVYCHENIRGMNLAVVHQDFPESVRLIPVLSLTKEVLAWQRLPLRKLWADYDAIIFYGNPRVLSNVVWATVFKMFGKRVGLWGQVHTAGATNFTEALRLLWWRCFRNLFVYTDGEVERLREKGFRAPNIVGMNNGLDQGQIESAIQEWPKSRLASWQAEEHLEGREILLSCARLERKNEFSLMVEALVPLVKHNDRVLWCVIGDGALRNQLVAEVNSVGLEDNVRWLGGIHMEEALAPWFLSARCLVHPGAIGLTLLHAFGYGLPVVTHDDGERHMPEFGAMRDGETGLLFKQGCPASLTEVLSTLLGQPDLRRTLGRQAQNVARTSYNCATMTERFNSFVAAMCG